MSCLVDYEEVDNTTKKARRDDGDDDIILPICFHPAVCLQPSFTKM